SASHPIPPPPSPTLFPYTTLFRSRPAPLPGEGGTCRPARMLADERGEPVEEGMVVLGSGRTLGMELDGKDRQALVRQPLDRAVGDRKSTRLNSSHRTISYAVFRLK